MAVQSRRQTYKVAGRQYEGYLADGSNGRKVPGILVAHEGRGFTKHPRDRAEMLAEMGYVAFALDYFGTTATSLEHAFELMSPFNADRSLFRAHGTAALDVLRAHPGVNSAELAAIGFCWGGYAVLELACFEPLKAIVGFHPGLSLGPLSIPDAMQASVLICVGDQDPHVPQSDIATFMNQMREAKVDCQILLLMGAPHSFTNPEPYVYVAGPGIGYDPVADRRAWAAMANHLAEAFAR